MSDQQLEPQVGSSPKEDLYGPEDFSAKDFYLDTLIDFIAGPDNDAPDSSMSMTLTVNGTVVTGDLISAGRWAEQVLQSITDAVEPIGKAFRRVHEAATDFDKKRTAEREALDQPPIARRFVHLQSVQLNPGHPNTVNLPLWRAPLADVDGWTLGRLGK
jgi:hypothetical protein